MNELLLYPDIILLGYKIESTPRYL
jgi:hypothetical protein